MASNRNKLITAIIEIASDKGFSVSYDTENDDLTVFEFRQNTSMGQDFHITCQMNGSDIATLIEDVENCYNAYDPDTEAMLWLDNDGHGKNGAPYRMKDVLEDMEECEMMIQELLMALIVGNSNQELWSLIEE